MTTRTMNDSQFELEDLPAEKSSPRILSVLAAIPAQFRQAKHIERQARQLYAMSDTGLEEIGLSRDEISARLLASYSR
ncbi:MAG TPA: hypothetical protein VKB27_01680 [Gammaproteobacteria bacterium]|nr:hypothetical protein [Gammaproteobacteria bacterium]